MGESVMEIRNREILFSLAWDKKIPAYFDLEGGSIDIELGKLKEDTYFDLSLRSNKHGMEKVGIDKIWVWMICPVCNDQCFGYIIADNVNEVNNFMNNYTLLKSDGAPLIDYGPIFSRLKDIFPMYQEWISRMIDKEE